MKRSMLMKHAMLASVLTLSAGFAWADTTLTGNQEVPPVTTAAKGTSTIKVNKDMTVTGSVKTTGMTGMMAHIHQAPAEGQNGPPIVSLKKVSDSEWGVPENTKLTADQYKAYEAGKLYVNVHSADHKGGEIRATLKP